MLVHGVRYLNQNYFDETNPFMWMLILHSIFISKVKLMGSSHGRPSLMSKLSYCHTSNFDWVSKGRYDGMNARNHSCKLRISKNEKYK